MPRILIIEDDTAFCQMLQKFLDKKGYEVEISLTAPDAKAKFKDSRFDLVLTDLRLPDYDGIRLLDEIKQVDPSIPVIVMTGYAEVGTAVTAMKKGAFDYISKPFTPDEMLTLIGNALERKPVRVITKKADIEIPTNGGTNKGTVTGISDASKKLNEYIKLVAPTNMSVLITGESGTGKEVTAKAIHDKSKRSENSFVAVDCGAIPKELATSEFFGHIKGSFTGAVEDKIGNFQAADGGTLFLDEVGNLSYENQIQLLRALQERKIKRVGSTKEIHVDVRIITATNEDLRDAVEKGTFREDLYHRLNEFSIEIPSLSERFEDLILFAEHFLTISNNSLNKEVKSFSDEVVAVFGKYHWPGNLRELQNTIKRAVLLTTGDEVQVAALPASVKEPDQTKMDMASGFSKSEYEKEQILRALKKTNFNKSKAAKLLQVTRKTLYNKINHYNLDL
ncbi:sigma-54-dependent transcriptional regulator [Costertonia aggregata]|uniref:Sigma-54-dependent Fis family transcriptional regulator n=1 Tax=Costertonia aggregata TaxID=343403 RepID=A0A7H9AQD2_9FLAO|nr:sigma-54 dependent transcriptional regulator [Costertonia aggregata]QLG45640.1 sigma-54-dependent Fis family transcriptional regulator [Costertonia aggregata]